MVKSKKIINIILNLMILTLLFMNLGLISFINGCTNTKYNRADTVQQEVASSNTIESDTDSSKQLEKDSSQLNQSQKNSNETTATKNDSTDKDNSGDASNKSDSKQGTESSNNNSKEQDNSLKGIYNRFIASGKPSILIFSYDADCCPGTKAFFDSYNASAKKVMEEYKAKFNVLFINIGILDKTNMETAFEIAKQNGVLNLPSILILDSSGKTYKVIEGVYDEAEIRSILDGMLNG